MKKVSISKIIKENGLPDYTVFDGYILQRVDTDEFLSIIHDNEFSCVFGWTPIPNLAKRFSQPHEPIVIAQEHLDKSMIVAGLFDVGFQNCVIPVHVAKHLEAMVSAIYD